jgi:hypothetical protein
MIEPVVGLFDAVGIFQRAYRVSKVHAVQPQI